MGWSASNYEQRKAERLLKQEPRWVINPETGERFYLRPVSGMWSSVLAASMPSTLTQNAVEGWKESGTPGVDDALDLVEKMTPEERENGVRETARLSAIIQNASVIPLFSNQPPDKIEFTEEWKAAAIKGLTELDPEFNAKQFDPKELVLNPQRLDDADANWLLFKYATGMATGIDLKGGGVIPMDDVSRFRKRLARGPGTRANRKAVRKAS
jgi:hypothetical protein